MKIGKIVLINISILITLIVILELSSDSLDRAFLSNYNYYQIETSFNRMRKELAKDSSHIPIWIRSTGQGSFDNGISFYINDDKSRRHPTSEVVSGHHALFFGGSFVFGQGLKSSETIPFLFQEFFKIKGHNYGVSGEGPISMHQRLKNNSNSLPNSKKVIGFYFLIEDHINRASLNLSHLMNSSFALREYEIENNKLVGGEFMLESSPLKFYTLMLLRKSSLVKVMMKLLSHQKRSEHIHYEEQDITLLDEMITDSRRLFLKKYPEGKFYVISLDLRQSLLRRFRKVQSQLLFSNSVFEMIGNDPKLFQPDGHLTAFGNQRVFQLIKETVQAQSQTKFADLLP